MSDIIDLTTGNFGYGFSDDYKQGYSDGGIKELERIKAEMDNKGWYNRHDKEQFAEIIDKHISELKGENNE